MNTRTRNREDGRHRGGFDSYLLHADASHPMGGDLQGQMALAYCRTRDPILEHRLIQANLRLVVKIAHEHDRSRGSNIEDLIQEGCMGLIEAVRRFDPTKGAQLSTYARFWIRAFIMRHIMDNVRVVRAVRTRAERLAFFRGVVGVSEVSFDSTTGPEGWPLQDVLREPAPSAEDALQASELAVRIKQRVAELERTLPAREALILRERLLSDDPRTRGEVGRRLSLSKERVRQIEGTLVAAIQHGVCSDGSARRGVAAAAAAAAP